MGFGSHTHTGYICFIASARKHFLFVQLPICQTILHFSFCICVPHSLHIAWQLVPSQGHAGAFVFGHVQRFEYVSTYLPCDEVCVSLATLLSYTNIFLGLKTLFVFSSSHDCLWFLKSVCRSEKAFVVMQIRLWFRKPVWGARNTQRHRFRALKQVCGTTDGLGGPSKIQKKCFRSYHVDLLPLPARL